MNKLYDSPGRTPHQANITRMVAQLREVTEINKKDDVVLGLHELRNNYQQLPYFSVGRMWSDYQPAYLLGAVAAKEAGATDYKDIEPSLELLWNAIKGQSRLNWVEAREAVHHAWQLAQA